MSRTVVIAGAGPTGLTLACELALAGIDTVVIEPNAEPNTRSRGMGIHGRTVEFLRQRGLADRISEADSFVWPRAPFALLWLDVAAGDERDHTIAHAQWRTEELLLGRATELGVDIRRGQRVVGFAQDDTGVTVRVEGPGGTTSVRAAHLVGCDGAESTVRELAGIAFPGDGLASHGLFADVPLTESIHDSFEAGLHPTGMAAAMPIEHGTLRLMAIELGAEPPAGDSPATLDELRAMIARISGREPDVTQARWVSRFGGRTRLADRYSAGRVLLAGDAAHEVFISGSQAMNAGIQDAANLGWKLAATITGWAPDGLLDTYESERRPVGEQICTHARATLMLLHPLEKMAPLRELLGELLRFDEVNRLLLRLPTAADYPMAGAHPLAGTRIPDLKLSTSDGVVGVADRLRHGRGVLLDFTSGADLAGWRDRVDVVSARPAPELDADTVLLRPDGYVAHAGPADESLRTALTTWFGEPANVSVAR